jgi:uncharacterized RDD family membrane protein YckC
VEYEDRVRIATPEGVDLELTLAGVGSRFTSAIVDALIQIALLIALSVAFALGGGFEGFGTAAFFLLGFLLFAGYDVLFEVLASGRTPGKRLTGIRVVRVDGSPVAFLTSAVRNVLRLVDILPSFYLVGIVAILLTPRNQRLGDLAAGTLVVRERLGAFRPQAFAVSAASGTAPPAEAAEWRYWDVSAVGEAELVAVRRFLDRRHDLTWDARAQLAGDLADGLRGRVGGAPPDLAPERFLEHLAAAKQARARA